VIATALTIRQQLLWRKNKICEAIEARLNPRPAPSSGL